MSVRVTLMDAKRANNAFEVHATLLKMEAERPSLKDNPQWQLIRMDAFEAFDNAFREAK